VQEEVGRECDDERAGTSSGAHADGLVADPSEPLRWSEARDIRRRERRKGLTEKNQVCAQISPSNAIVDCSVRVHTKQL